MALLLSPGTSALDLPPLSTTVGQSRGTNGNPTEWYPAPVDPFNPSGTNEWAAEIFGDNATNLPLYGRVHQMPDIALPYNRLPVQRLSIDFATYFEVTWSGASPSYRLTTVHSRTGGTFLRRCLTVSNSNGFVAQQPWFASLYTDVCVAVNQDLTI